MSKSVGIITALTLAACASWAGEPGGTPDELFFSEAAAASAVGVVFFVGGYALGGDPKENEGTNREKASYAVYGMAPLASALTLYFYGEAAGHRSANRFAVALATTGTFYGLTGAAAGIAYAATDKNKDAGALTAAFYSVIPAAFAGAAIYNAVKKPLFYEIPGYSMKVEPSVGLYRGVDGEAAPLPTWGVTISF